MSNLMRASVEEEKDESTSMDAHAMFALEALEDPSTITLSPTEKEADTYPLKIGRGGTVVIGNGFVYFSEGIERK